MYRPPAFREDRPAALHALIRAHPLGQLVTAGPAGLMANPVPFALAEDAGGTVLRCHLARANPQLAELAAGAAVLVLFGGPQAYVRPGWYPGKAEHGRVVPTWNYLTVQARGTARLHDDPAWLGAHLDALTLAQEGARPEPWSPSHAPPAFLDAQLKGIVGVEIAACALIGKWKLSQNRNPADRAGVVAGLAAEGQAALAAAVAEAAPDRDR
jgi:transcriptional regulator